MEAILQEVTKGWKLMEVLSKKAPCSLHSNSFSCRVSYVR